MRRPLPGGGAAFGGGIGGATAYPPISRSSIPEHSQRPVDAGQCARLRALSTTLPSPDREIVLLRVVAGLSIPADERADTGGRTVARRSRPEETGGSGVNGFPGAFATPRPAIAARPRGLPKVTYASLTLCTLEITGK